MICSAINKISHQLLMILSFGQMYYFLSCMKYKDDVRRNVWSALFQPKKKKSESTNLNNKFFKALSGKQMLFSIQPKGIPIYTLNPQNK